jgi:hypothetical protein
MGQRGGLKPEVAFLVPAIIAIEMLWLGSLDYIFQRFGAFGLAAVVFGSLTAMVAWLDAAPLDEARKL